MIRVLHIILFALATCFLQTLAAPPADMIEARAFCDNADLRPIEGLWSYPDDDVTVLIFRSDEKKGVYDITIVEAADCSLTAGMKIGELTASADPDKFNMKLFTSMKKGILTSPLATTAVFSDNKESLTIRKSSFQIRLNPIRLLPSFWRLVSVSIKSKEPAPEGMIRVYPSYDGNLSTKRAPRYL